MSFIRNKFAVEHYEPICFTVILIYHENHETNLFTTGKPVEP